MNCDDWRQLLRGEEAYRKEEQSALLKAILSTSSGKLGQLRRAGVAITGLKVESSRSRFGGKIILELQDTLGNTGQTNNSNSSNNCWKAGQPCRLVSSGKIIGEGLFEGLKGTSISVSIGEDVFEANDFSNCTLSLVQALDDTFLFGRMHANLNRFESSDTAVKRALQSALQSKREALSSNRSEKTTQSSSFQLPKQHLPLNEEQIEAVKVALSADALALIHGPPGTGKTQVLVELLLQLRLQNKKILVCGPSNLAVDNVMERYLKHIGTGKASAIRMGHGSRVIDALQAYTLDAIAAASDAGRLLEDVKNEIDRNLNTRCTSKEERRALFAEVKQLRAERRERERNLVVELLAQAQVVFCTLGTASGPKLCEHLPKYDEKRGRFDVVIVDEATQALLPESLCAVSLAKEKLILAGDHCQLPPTVMNPELMKTLGVSLFEQLMRLGLPDSVMLCEQYRMNNQIMAWSNDRFYGGKLRAHPRNADWKLDQFAPVVFIDTAGFDLYEAAEEVDDSVHLVAEQSKSNEGEARIAIRVLKQLLDSGLDRSEVAIISPYSAQVSLLRSLCPQEAVQIGSIDGFQGREKEAIILSLVRSNQQGECGFLDEMRRLNVAMTRAKKHLCVIGDSDTLRRNSLLKNLIDFLHDHAELDYPE